MKAKVFILLIIISISLLKTTMIISSYAQPSNSLFNGDTVLVKIKCNFPLTKNDNHYISYVSCYEVNLINPLDTMLYGSKIRLYIINPYKYFGTINLKGFYNATITFNLDKIKPYTILDCSQDSLNLKKAVLLDLR